MNLPYNILPNSFIEVLNGSIVSNKPLNLAVDFVTHDGRTVRDIKNLSPMDRLAIGVYPVLEVLPVNYNDKIQSLVPNYIVGEASVTLTYSVVDDSIIDLKNRAIKNVYVLCKEKLDTLSEPYSVIEVALFPAIQSEVKEFDLTGVIGVNMQDIVGLGVHSPESLSLAINEKEIIKKAALTDRATAVTTINNAVLASDLLSYL